MRAIHQHNDADAASTETRAVSEAPSPWLAVRVILSVGAAVLLLVGSFLEWVQGTEGSALAVQSYWETDAGTAGFFSSAGLVTALVFFESGVPLSTPVLSALAVASLIEVLVPLRRQSRRANGRLATNLWLLAITLSLATLLNFTLALGAVYALDSASGKSSNSPSSHVVRPTIRYTWYCLASAS